MTLRHLADAIEAAIIAASNPTDDETTEFYSDALREEIKDAQRRQEAR